MANINKIRLSGTTYNIEDSNATKTVELTQAQYDALSTKDPNTFYIITDAQGADLSQYYTSAQTESAITQAVSGKVDNSTYTAYTAATDSALANKLATSDFNTYSGTVDTTLSGKQDTLSAGTGIDITDNVISATGGGGKNIVGGRGITVTTGETADTVSFNLPISAGTGTDSIIGCSIYNTASKSNSVALGSFNKASGDSSMAVNDYNVAGGKWSFAGGTGTKALGDASTSFGYNTNANKDYSFAVGRYNNANNVASFACGACNISSSASTTFGHSGNTLFSVGNGYNKKNKHNVFEIRENGDIYIADTNDTSTTNYYEKPMIKLQDSIGGGGGTSYSAGTGIDITNDVISVTGKVDTSAITTSVTSSSTDAQVPSAKCVYDQLGGLKLVKLTQSAYDALSPDYDSNTLYIIKD